MAWCWAPGMSRAHKRTRSAKAMDPVQATLPQVASSSNSVVPSVQLDRLEQAVSLLLSPAKGECWRQDVVVALRGLLEADRAIMFLTQGATSINYRDSLAPEVIEEYQRDFEPLDYGMIRRDALRLSPWSRRLLWDPPDLLRSTYYNDFALRHDLMDTVGVSLNVEGTLAHVRVVLLYGGGPLPGDRVDAMLQRLNLILPVLRTGLGIHLRYERWIGTIPSMLDRIGERLVLFSRTGRELHRNVTMRRTLQEDPDHDRILEAVQRVAHAVLAHAQGNGRELSALLATPDASRQHIRTATGHYRVRGCLVGPDMVDPETPVLVSVERTAPEPPGPEVLRERFGLTEREVQVASLLAQRLTNGEIATTLGISTHTARHHTENVLLKVGVNSRRALHRRLLGG
jgi:DNA-binding CsgD family transcriptional regulator